MKISIWQQFSSNHSASFTLVGEFATHQEAQAAGDTLRNILNRIQNWFYNEEAQETFTKDKYAPVPLPLGIEIFEPYKIELQSPLDWIKASKIDQDVQAFDNLVIFQHDDSYSHHWGHNEPFADLFIRLGATLKRAEESSSIVTINIFCTAPDEATALYVYNALTYPYVKAGEFPPWHLYPGGKFNAERIGLIAWMNEHKKWQKRLLAAQNEARQFEEKHPLKPQLKQRYRDILSEEPKPADGMTPYAASAFYLGRLPSSGKFIREDNAITLQNIFFPFNGMAIGFPAIIAWMRAQGCKVEYELIQM